MKKAKDKTQNGGSNLWGVLLFTLLVLIDQITKLVADVYFSAPDTPNEITLIEGVLWLRIVYNRGISFGIGNDAEEWVKILVISGTAAMMLVLALVYFFTDKRRNWVRNSLVFIVAGGIGNFIDRVVYRVWDVTTAFGVRDMVDLSTFGFAVCNFADFFIVGGAIALVLSLLFFDKDAVWPLGKYKALAKENEKEETNG